jgi:hypothetical protein
MARRISLVIGSLQSMLRKMEASLHLRPMTVQSGGSGSVIREPSDKEDTGLADTESIVTDKSPALVVVRLPVLIVRFNLENRDVPGK